MTTPGPDEQERLTVPRLPLDAVVEVDAEVLAERLVSLPDEANALVRLLDGRRTLREAIAGSGQEEIEATRVLRRLHEQGILRVAAVPAPPPSPTPPPDGAEWFAGPDDVELAAPSEGAADAEPDPRDPAPLRGVEWVRSLLARLRA